MRAVGALLLVFGLAGCVSQPLSGHTAEEIKAIAQIKDAAITCISLGTPWGKQTATFVNVDKGVLPNGEVTVDPDCKATVKNAPKP